MIVNAQAPSLPPASSRVKVGTQDYPANPALDTWAKSAEYASVPSFFRMAVAKNPDGPYVGAKEGDQYKFRSYREVEGQAETFSSALIGAGVQPGDRVATFAENSPDWRVGDLGVAYAGAVHATLLAELAERTLEYVLKDSQAKLLVVDNKNRLEMVLRAEPRLNDLQTIVVSGDVDLSTVKSSKKLVSLKDFMAGGAASLSANRAEMEQRISGLRADDIDSIVYTSGSTGDPKGVLLSHGNILAAVESALRRINNNEAESLKSARRDDVYPSVLPQGHVMGRVADYAMTAEGGAIAYPAGLMAFKKDLKELKPTVVAVTPLFFQKIYEAVEKKVLREETPVVPPFVAGLVAGAGGAGLCALGGALVGSAAGGGALSWVLGLTGAVIGGAVADRLGSRVAEKTTKASLFQSAMATSKKYYQSRNRPSLLTSVGHKLGQKFVFSKVREQIDANLGDRARLMMSGGAPLGADAETLFRGAGYNIAQGYGLSETCAGALMNDPFNAQLGTVGMPLPGLEVRLADDKEIQVRGASVMSGGYLNKQDKTQESFTKDGWYRTGDTGQVVLVPRHMSAARGGAIGAAVGGALGAVVGHVLGMPLAGSAIGAAVTGLGALGITAARGQTDEYYTITGRIKSQFKLPGGEYVTPEPIEEELKSSIYISEAVVVGAKDRDMVGAVIVPKFDNLKAWAAQRGLPTEPQQMVAHPDVIALLKSEASTRSANRAKHELVRAVVILDREFSGDEMTPTMKVKRPVVLDHYARQIDEMFK